MINIDVNIDFSGLEAEVRAFEKTKIRVGVLDSSLRVKKAKRKADLKNFHGSKASRAGKQTQLPMKKLAEYLDTRYGVFSSAAKNFNNHDLNKITQELVKYFTSSGVNQRRLENAAIALVRNPIYRKDFGDNKASTQKSKGFDWPMVDTGRFFNSIEAEYIE